VASGSPGQPLRYSRRLFSFIGQRYPRSWHAGPGRANVEQVHVIDDASATEIERRDRALIAFRW
jgi:hypothetical protein